MKKLIITMILALAYFWGYAQISGTVYDEASNDPLIGATIFNKSNQDGTITDIDGAFTIDGSVGDVLEISYVGYGTKEMEITSAKADYFLSIGTALE